MTIQEIWSYLITYHRGKTIGAVSGLAFGLLIVVLGWKLLVLIFFALIGLIIGKSIDEDSDPRDIIKKLFGN